MSITTPRGQHAPNSPLRLAIVSVSTVITILLVIFVVQDLSKRPILVASLASSTFLLYYQPLNEVNRFGPLVFGHMMAAGIGFVTSLYLPHPYASAAVAISASVVLMSLFRIVYPPAVSTALVFSYTERDVSALGIFALTLSVVIAIAGIYLLLRFGIKPRPWSHLFGLQEET